MPLRPANTLQLDGRWRDWLRTLCRHCADEGAAGGNPAGAARVAAADDAWLDAQAHAVLERDDAPSVDAVAALLVMNALQVYWAVLAASFRPTDLKPLADAPGLCPLCGTLPVTSVVQARHPMRPTATCRARCAPASGTTCACSAASVVPPARTSPIAPWLMWTATAAGGARGAVRAETCDHCHSYRKILYLEKDPSLEPVADDLGTLALDLLLGEEGYARASQNPLLWQSDGD
jgi:FdhE protein